MSALQSTVFLAFAICLAFADINIISEVNQQVLVNNVPFQRHTAQVQATEVGQQTYLVNGDKQYEVVITVDKPQFLFSVELMGYIARGLYREYDENCLLLQQVNQTAIIAEANALLGRDSMGIPTGNIYKPSGVETSSFSFPSLQSSAVSKSEMLRRTPADFDPITLKTMEVVLLKMPLTGLKFMAKQTGSSAIELRNLGFSMRVGQVSPRQRKLQQFAAGFLGGVVGGFAYSVLFGGGGDDGVDQALQAIAKQLQFQVTFNAQTVQFEGDMEREQDYSFGAIEAMQTQFNAQTQFNSYVNKSLYTQIDVDRTISTALTTGLTSVNSQVAALASSQLQIDWYLRNQSQALNYQFGNMTAATQQVDKDVSQLEALAFRWYQKLDMRRFLTSAITTTSFSRNTDNIPTRPFTSNLGVEPLAASDRARVKNICLAPRVASVNINYQIGSTAHQTTYEFICDQDFILNNVFPFVDFKTLLYWLGPGSAGGQRCYHTDDGSTCTSSQYNVAWNCTCVIQRTEYSCAMATPSTIWPFGYFDTIKAESLLAYQKKAQATGAASVCSSGYTAVNTPQSQTPMDHLPGSDGFFSDLGSLCSNVKSSATASGGYKAQMTSRYFRRPINVAVGSSETCVYSNNLFLQNDFSSNGFGYTIFHFWQLSYQIIAGTTIPDLDRTWHGVIPTGVKALTSPIGRVSDSAHAKSPADCATVYFTRVWDDEEDPVNNKLPVYVLRPITVDHSMSVTVTPAGGDATTPVPVGTSININAANFSDGSGTVQWTTDLALTSDYADYLPAGDPMFIAGGLAIPGMRDTVNPLVIHDIPTWKWGSPGDCYRINYIYESASWDGVTSTSLLNVTDWMVNFAQFYDPECADTSAHLYMREYNPSTKTCDKFFDPRYVPEPPPSSRYITGGLNYRICNILERFEMAFTPGSGGAPDILSMSPKQFILTGNVQFPAGQITKEVTTECPDVNVTTADGLAIVTLTTTSTTTITVHVEVTSNSSAVGCQTAESVQLSASNPKQLFIPACGQQIFNVREVGNASWCFLGGLSLNVTQQTGGDENIGKASKVYVQTAIDASVAAAHQLSVSVGRAYWLLSMIPTLGVQNAAAQIDAIISDVQNVLSSNSQLVQYLNQTNSSLQASIAQLQQDAAGASNALQNQINANAQTNVMINLFNKSIPATKGDTFASNFTLQEEIAQQKVVDAAVAAVHDKDCNSKPFFDRIICNFEQDFFRVFQGLITILLIAGAIYLFVVFGWPLLKEACKKKPKDDTKTSDHPAFAPLRPTSTGTHTAVSISDATPHMDDSDGL